MARYITELPILRVLGLVTNFIFFTFHDTKHAFLTSAPIFDLLRHSNPGHDIDNSASGLEVVVRTPKGNECVCVVVVGD